MVLDWDWSLGIDYDLGVLVGFFVFLLCGCWIVWVDYVFKGIVIFYIKVEEWLCWVYIEVLVEYFF